MTGEWVCIYSRIFQEGCIYAPHQDKAGHIYAVLQTYKKENLTWLLGIHKGVQEVSPGLIHSSGVPVKPLERLAALLKEDSM